MSIVAPNRYARDIAPWPGILRRGWNANTERSQWKDQPPSALSGVAKDIVVEVDQCQQQENGHGKTGECT
ncbi:MAG: hypothetical protein ACOY7J_15665, partial [Pseudomonadota bacterium]